MRRFAPALLSCLAFTACGDEARQEGNAASTGAAEESKSIVPEARMDRPDESKPGTSVMRPSVVAETEVPAAPEVRPAIATVRFAERTVALDDEARKALDLLLDEAALAAGGAVVIRGHSDSRGYDGDNLVASRKRAEAVYDYLAEHGVAKERMKVIALGEGRPVAPNVKLDGTDNPEGRARNRRVEIEVRVPNLGAAEASPTQPGQARAPKR